MVKKYFKCLLYIKTGFDFRELNIFIIVTVIIVDTVIYLM